MQVGGAILGLEARAQLDAAVAHQAATAAAGCERASRSGAPAPRSVQAVRLAAMRALLASVLAPCGHRPPFIAQALHFFRQARLTCSHTLDMLPPFSLFAQLYVHPWSYTKLAAAWNNMTGSCPRDALAVMFLIPARPANFQQPFSSCRHQIFHKLRMWDCGGLF